MNQTPTGGSRRPSFAAEESDGDATDDADATAPGPDEARVPAQRFATDPLPRRKRPGDRPGGHPQADPDGRRHGDADDETLHRLLTWLRDV